jgi:site-specific DNA-adenine methylase
MHGAFGTGLNNNSQLTLNPDEPTPKRLEFRHFGNVNNPKSIHGIFPYRGKMSPVDAASIVRQLPPQGRLLDPFCGSGTIVYESQKWGIETIGVDNNPLAILLSRAKTQPLDKADTLDRLNHLITEAESVKTPPDMPGFAKAYFHERTADQIMRLRTLTDSMNDYLKAAYFGAIALAARACNHYQWSSNSIGKIILPHRLVNFYSLFQQKAKKHIQDLEHKAECTIFEHDARDLKPIIAKDSVDYVYTSPPYFDALDYTSYYSRIVYSILGFDRKAIRERLIQRVSTYESDMKTVMQQIDSVTNDHAVVVFVVGDKKTEEGIINGGEFFSQLCEWKPSYVIERQYTGSSSQIWDSINKTRRKEQIVVWEKGTTSGPMHH